MTRQQLQKQMEDALDWQNKAVVEATITQMKTGLPPKVVVTDKLIKKHKDKAKNDILHLIDEYAEHERKEAYEAGYRQGRVDEESKRHAEPNPQADNTKPETVSRRAGIGEGA